MSRVLDPRISRWLKLSLTVRPSLEVNHRSGLLLLQNMHKLKARTLHALNTVDSFSQLWDPSTLGPHYELVPGRCGMSSSTLHPDVRVPATTTSCLPKVWTGHTFQHITTGQRQLLRESSPPPPPIYFIVQGIIFSWNLFEVLPQHFYSRWTCDCPSTAWSSKYQNQTD